MIIKEQGEEIKNIIGVNYSNKVAVYLHKKAVRNGDGLPYTAHYIRNVVNGSTHCEELESYIFDAVKYYKRKAAREEKRRKALLQAS